MKRRTFVEHSLKLGVAIPFAGSYLTSCLTKNDNESKKLNILILGGTSFLGPHQIAYAMERGHSITTFTRGKTQPTIYKELFDKVTQLTGDRANDLSALATGTWDAVIDNSGHNVEWAKKSAALLKDRVGLYLFTSSTGVYYPYLGSNMKEEDKVLLKEPETVENEEEKIEYWYGVMKANSELAVKAEFGTDRTIAVRPTYMIGPADKSNRFIHWPVRLAKGGEIMVPGKPTDPVQYADVRDVAEFMIRLIEGNKVGTYNAVGPQKAQTMPAFVKEASTAFSAESNLIQIDDYGFLKEQHVTNVVPWIMPVGNNSGSALINNEKSIQAGLTFRPLPKTVKDTYDWWYSDALSDEKRNTFEQNTETVYKREASILEAWKEFEKAEGARS